MSFTFVPPAYSKFLRFIFRNGYISLMQSLDLYFDRFIILLDIKLFAYFVYQALFRHFV